MKKIRSMDNLNTDTMSHSVDHYCWTNELYAQEKAALAAVPDLQGQAILDIGVGSGRTAYALLDISKNYIGVDYVDAMVKKCRDRFPGVRFEQADGRDLSRFEDKSFYMIMFSLNGIDMVDHNGRMAIMREVKRLLKPGGYFLFSSYNRDCDEIKRLLELPEFEATINPVKIVVRGMRFLKNLAISIRNRIRYKKLEIRTPEYAILNGACHNYATMLYFTTVEYVKKQLIEAGFNNGVTCIDLKGVSITAPSLDNSIFYIARTDVI